MSHLSLLFCEENAGANDHCLTYTDHNVPRSIKTLYTSRQGNKDIVSL
jgi:hypothetical protein